MLVQLYVTDGGQGKSKRAKEKSTCTVRALATFLDVPFDYAYALLQKAGRARGKGTLAHKKILEDLGHLKVPGELNLRNFLESEPIGTYYVCVPSHAFVVKDGVIHDGHFYMSYLNHSIEVWIKSEPKKLSMKLKI